ncbi:MAG TPA: 30S ribosomal protein S13, partial [Anaerolineaceae bacterium]|nr:30S ribosomal protein S13 [Anaerolineaceae bacterium]
MARIEGVDLPRNKRIEVGLTYIFGIGPTRANQILKSTQVNPDIRV